MDLADEAANLFRDAQGEVVLGDSVGLISSITEILSQPADVAILIASGNKGDDNEIYQEVVKKWKNFYDMEDVRLPLLVVVRSSLNPMELSMFDPQDNYGVIVGLDRKAYEEGVINTQDACIEGIVFEIGQAFDIIFTSAMSEPHRIMMEEKWPSVKDIDTWRPESAMNLSPEKRAKLSGLEQAYLESKRRPDFQMGDEYRGRAETFESEWVVEAVQQNLNDKNFVNSAYTVLIGGDAKTFEEKSMAIAETMNQNANNPSFTSFVESELFSAENFNAESDFDGKIIWDWSAEKFVNDDYQPIPKNLISQGDKEFIVRTCKEYIREYGVYDMFQGDMSHEFEVGTLEGDFLITLNWKLDWDSLEVSRAENFNAYTTRFSKKNPNTRSKIVSRGRRIVQADPEYQQFRKYSFAGLGLLSLGFYLLARNSKSDNDSNNG